VSEPDEINERLAKTLRMAAMSDRALVQGLLGAVAKYITDEEVQQVMDAFGEVVKRSWYRHRATSTLQIEGSEDEAS
jgi:hypothetical protein